MLPQVRSGRVRVLAVTSAQRYSALPEVPTFIEEGRPSVDSRDWRGLFAPAGTPVAVIARLHDAVSKAVAAPEFARDLANAASEPWVGTSDDLRRFLATDIVRWGSASGGVGGFRTASISNALGPH